MFWTYTLSNLPDFDDFSSDKSIVYVTTTKELHGALILIIRNRKTVMPPPPFSINFPILKVVVFLTTSN